MNSKLYQFRKVFDRLTSRSVDALICDTLVEVNVYFLTRRRNLS